MCPASCAYIENQLIDPKRFRFENDFPESVRNDVLATVVRMNDSFGKFSAMAAVRHRVASHHAEEHQVAAVNPDQSQGLAFCNSIAQLGDEGFCFVDRHALCIAQRGTFQSRSFNKIDDAMSLHIGESGKPFEMNLVFHSESLRLFDDCKPKPVPCGQPANDWPALANIWPYPVSYRIPVPTARRSENPVSAPSIGIDAT